MSTRVEHLYGEGHLLQDGTLVGEGSYHLELLLDEEGEPYEITGTVIAPVPPGSDYTLQIADGRTVACTLTMRDRMPAFFTVEAEGVLQESSGA